MVTERKKVGIFSAESGVALTEALIVMPIMVLAVAVCVEFTHVMYQWNSAAKAMQLGVRKLIVSDPVTVTPANWIDPNLPDFDPFFLDPALSGPDPIPANAAVQLVCGAGAAAACDADKMDRLVNGNGVWPGLRAYYPSIELSDIRVTYERSGLGYNGRPTGPVVTVRLDLFAGPIDLPFLGGLLGMAGFIFPPFTVTATSEDLITCPGSCP
jgi:hypothetical protein